MIDVPVLNQGYADWVEMGTAAVILLGFGWVMWKLWLFGRDRRLWMLMELQKLKKKKQ